METHQKIFQTLRQLIDSAIQPILIINPQEEIVLLNRPAEKLFNYNLGELTGKSIHILIPEGLRDRLHKYYQHFSSNGHSHMMDAGLDIYGLRKDGTEIPIDIGLSKITLEDQDYFINFVSDIQRRKKTEDALRESEARYRRLFEDDLTGNFITDANGNIQMCNPAFARLFGFSSPTAAERSNFFDRFPSAQSKSEFLSRLHTDMKLELYETALHRTDASLIYVMANIVGRYGESGNLLRIKGYLLDVTRRKEIENQFIQAQKMESLGLLAGSIAHDFSNFVSIIEGYTDIVLQGMPAEDRMRKFVEKIRQTNKQAALLINQIQTFSRRQETQPQKINVNEAMESIEEMLRRLIGKKIQFSLELSPEVGRVRIDPVQIEQVIMNLAVNSRDAMPNGGTLSVGTYQVELTNQDLLHSDIRPGKYICIQVSDTGAGMDDATKARIFEPFFTTKARDKGTGLGLSTVYGIVKQNHGDINVSTAPGLGTIFRIYFPVILPK